MTDKLPRRSGGDGGGPDDTPMEQLLREAMNARATQITAHSLRQSAPPKSRVRRLRPAYIAAVPLFGLAAAMAFGVLGFRGDSVARQDDQGPAATATATVTATVTASPSPTAEPTPAQSPTAATTATSPPAADPGEEDKPAKPAGAATSPSTPTSSAPPLSAPVSYTFRGVKFKVPAGWKVVPPAPTDTSLCVLSPGAPAGAEQSCVPYGVQIASYLTADEAEHAIWPTAFDLDAPDGFSHQPYCPVWGHPYVPDGPVKIGTPVRSRDIVAGRPINKTQWQVTCKPGDEFTAQMWGLKTDQVYIVANGLKAEYQPALVSILDTIDLSGRQAPQPAAGQAVAVTVDGLVTGQQVLNDGSPVAFSVTFKNTGQTTYGAVVPQVFAEAYAGSQPAVHGTMERQDGAAWTTLDIAQPAAGKPTTAGAFALAPGQSVTVKYRMKLTGQDGAGVMPVTANALVIPDQGPFTTVGTRSIPVRVAGQ